MGYIPPHGGYIPHSPDHTCLHMTALLIMVYHKLCGHDCYKCCRRVCDESDSDVMLAPACDFHAWSPSLSLSQSPPAVPLPAAHGSAAMTPSSSQSVRAFRGFSPPTMSSSQAVRVNSGKMTILSITVYSAFL